MKRAIYPGSFDPITLGHVDIIGRVAKQVDELIVVVAQNSEKNYLFTAKERAKLISESIKNLKGVKVVVHEGLISDYAREQGVKLIIRGLRAVSDFEFEMAVANMNRTLYKDLETLIVFSSPEYGHVASRLVKEVAKFGGALNGLVTPAVAKAIKSKLSIKK
jgi:pantetheine-phosphate adenylyltransferase